MRIHCGKSYGIFQIGHNSDFGLGGGFSSERIQLGRFGFVWFWLNCPYDMDGRVFER